jgi:formate C-acetyltransferase
MIMTFSMAPVMGGVLGASPDGRFAKTPLAHGVSPAGSSMTEGITTAMRSAGNLEILHFAGGASHIWDLDKNLAMPETVKHLLKTFFALGGQMFHGNMTDHAELIDAQKDPENHKGVIVRVGGFSAQFTRLSKNVQDEVISRIRHNK